MTARPCGIPGIRESSRCFPDRIVPKGVIARDHGPRKRRIKRQFMAPCPLTGNMVPCKELEPVYCWESPGKGFLFGFSLDIDPSVKVIDGGIGPD